MTIQIANDTSGIESLAGCQIYLSGTFVILDSLGTAPGALSAMYQQYSSIIRVAGSTTITFSGTFKTVLNGEGTGEIEFINTGTTGGVQNVNNVICASGTKIGDTSGGSFIDAELHSIIHLEPGWNFDYANSGTGASGCGASAGIVTAVSQPNTYQAALQTGAFLNNETGSNLPEPCTVGPTAYYPCVKIQTGAILAPYGLPTTVSASCSQGAIVDGSTNYAGGVVFSAGNTSCLITFGYAGGTTTTPPTPTSTTTPTPAFTGTPMCTATSSPYNSASPSNYVSETFVTTSTGIVTGITLTPSSSSGWVDGDTVYYNCSAPANG